MCRQRFSAIWNKSLVICSQGKGYNYSTFEDGKNDFNCKTMKQAENHIDFLKGKRNREF